MKMPYVLFVAVSLLARLQAQPVQNAPTATGAVRGYVYCADTAQPARFAVVRIQSVPSLGLETKSGSSTANAARTTTGLDGSFFVDGLNPGDYFVLASQEGYVYPLAGFAWNDLIVDSRSPAEPVRRDWRVFCRGSRLSRIRLLP